MPHTKPVDRSGEVFALWEQQAAPAKPELPWAPATSVDLDRLRTLLGSAKTAVIAASNARFLVLALQALPSAIRAYAYGPAAAEQDAALQALLPKLVGQLHLRLGFELAADWICVDGGRDGLVLVGPPSKPRQWAIPLERPFSGPALFEAFKVLFWFHARRECLPDPIGYLHWGAPLASPFTDPGSKVQLPAGVMYLHETAPDLLATAEIVIAPDGGLPARAALALAPPSPGDFSAAELVASNHGRVVWSDLGLPRMALTRNRLMMDLGAGPIGIHLEWPSAVAVDVFHRVERAASSPEWAYFPARRLDGIRAEVLMKGADKPSKVIPLREIPLGDIVTPLTEMEFASPKVFPPPPPLALQVRYTWRTVPETVPAGAARAALVRSWIAVDEWQTDCVRVLRHALESIADEEQGLFQRLRAYFTANDGQRRERQNILDSITDVAEQPLSQRSVKEATEAVAEVNQLAVRTQKVQAMAHDGRQLAEDRAAEAEQRTQWGDRVAAATQSAAKGKEHLATAEGQLARAEERLRLAEEAVNSATARLREKRQDQLEADRIKAEAEIERLRNELKELDGQQKGPAPDAIRKPLVKERDLQQQNLAAAIKGLEGLKGWQPPSGDIASETNAQREARNQRDRARSEVSTLQAAHKRSELEANEEFAFRKGNRLPAGKTTVIAAAPAVPNEEMPEIGDLFEFQGKRYLAIKTWEQVPKAQPVANRLNAKLVANASAPK